MLKKNHYERVYVHKISNSFINKKRHEKNEKIITFKKTNRIVKILKTHDENLKKIMKTIENWFQNHFDCDVVRLKFQKNKNKIVSILQHLSREYENWFNIDHEKNFIRNTFIILIQRHLFNKQQNLIKAKKNKSK